jgi:hypothetical protein
MRNRGWGLDTDLQNQIQESIFGERYCKQAH